MAEDKLRYNGMNSILYEMDTTKPYSLSGYHSNSLILCCFIHLLYLLGIHTVHHYLILHYLTSSAKYVRKSRKKVLIEELCFQLITSRKQPLSTRDIICYMVLLCVLYIYLGQVCLGQIDFRMYSP